MPGVGRGAAGTAVGWAGTGVHFDPIIAGNAAHWLRANAATLDQPWFLTVALVNPHDVMWYPIDQPWYAPAQAEFCLTKRGEKFWLWKEIWIDTPVRCVRFYFKRRVFRQRRRPEQPRA